MSSHEENIPTAALLQEFKALANIWQLQKALLNKFKNIKVAFIILDAGNQGFLLHHDFSTRLEAKGFPNQDATHENLFQFLDNDRDGKITLADWNNGFKRIGERLCEIKELLAQNGKSLPPGVLLSPTLPNNNSSFFNQSASKSLQASHAGSENFKQTVKPNLQINRSLTDNTFERQNQIISPTSGAFPLNNYSSPTYYKKFEPQEDNMPHFGGNSPYTPGNTRKLNSSNNFNPESLRQSRSQSRPKSNYVSFYVGSPVSEDLEVSQDGPENEHITKINFGGAKVHEVPKVFVTSEHPLKQEANTYSTPHSHLQTSGHEARFHREEKFGSGQRLQGEGNWHLEQPVGETDLSGSKTLFDTRDMQGEIRGRSVATSLQGSVNERKWDTGMVGASPVMERYTGVGFTNEREKSVEGRLVESIGYSEGRGFEKSKRENERDIEEETMKREQEVNYNSTSGYKSIDNKEKLSIRQVSSPSQLYASGAYSDVVHKSNSWTDMHHWAKSAGPNTMNMEPPGLKTESYNPEYSSHHNEPVYHHNKDVKYGAHNKREEMSFQQVDTWGNNSLASINNKTLGYHSISFEEPGCLKQALEDKRQDLELKDLIDIPPNGAVKLSGEIRHSEDISSNVSSNDNNHARSVKESVTSLQTMDWKPSKANHVVEAPPPVQERIEALPRPAQFAISIVDMERELKRKSEMEKNKVPKVEEVDEDVLYSLPERLHRGRDVKQRTCNILIEDSYSRKSAQSIPLVRSHEYLGEVDVNEEDHHMKMNADAVPERASMRPEERSSIENHIAVQHGRKTAAEEEEDYRNYLAQKAAQKNFAGKFGAEMPDITETEEANEVSVLATVTPQKTSESPLIKFSEQQNTRYDDQVTPKSQLQGEFIDAKRERIDKMPLQMVDKKSEGVIQLTVDDIRMLNQEIREKRNIENTEGKREELINILERIERSLQEDEERKKELKKLEGAKQKTETLRIQQKKLVSDPVEEDKTEKSFLSESSEKKITENQERNTNQMLYPRNIKQVSRSSLEEKEDRPLQREEDMKIFKDDYWNLQLNQAKPKNQYAYIPSNEEIERESTVSPSEKSRGGSLQALDLGRFDKQKAYLPQVQNVEPVKVNKVDKTQENMQALKLKIQQEKERRAERQNEKKGNVSYLDELTENISRLEAPKKNNGVETAKAGKGGRSIRDILKDLNEIPLKKKQEQVDRDVKTNSSFEDSILNVWEQKLKRHEKGEREVPSKENIKEEKGKRNSVFDTMLAGMHKTSKTQDENKGKTQEPTEKRSLFQQSVLQTLNQKQRDEKQPQISRNQQKIPTQSSWEGQQRDESEIITHESFESQKAGPLVSAFEPHAHNKKDDALKRIEGLLTNPQQKSKTNLNISNDFTAQINKVRNMMNHEGKRGVTHDWEANVPKKRESSTTESDKAQSYKGSIKTEESEVLSNKLEALLGYYESKVNKKNGGLKDITNQDQNYKKDSKEKRDSFGSQHTKGLRIDTGNEDDLEAVRSLSSVMFSGRTSYLPNMKTEPGDFTFLSKREESKDSNGVTSFPKSFLARIDDRVENGSFGVEGTQGKQVKEQNVEDIYQSLVESLGTFSLKVKHEKAEKPSILTKLGKGQKLKELIHKDLGGLNKANLINELTKLEAVNKQLNKVNESLKKIDEDYWTV